MPDASALSAFHFLRPWWFLLLIPSTVPLLFWWRGRDPMARWRRVIAPHLLRHILIGGEHSRWFNPVAVNLPLSLLVIVALAGPSWERRASPFAEDLGVLVIALDTSASMNAADVQPTRLERAKQKIEDLLRLRTGARTALLVYAGSAHRVLPPSNDPDIVRNFLDAIDTSLLPRAGKSPELLLPLLHEMVDGLTEPATLLLISDAPGNAGARFTGFFEISRMQLLVLGIGSADAQDAPLDEGGLKKLASSAGGSYQRVTLDDSDVRAIDRHIRSHLVIAPDTTRPWVDAGYWLTLPIAALCLLWFRRGWTLQWCVLMGVAAGIGYTPPASAEWRVIDLWLTPDQQGRWYLEHGDYHSAAERFRDPLWKGIAYYLAEDFGSAAEQFAGLDSVTAVFNLGNAQAQARDYLEAVRCYERVLALVPDHPGARRNRAIVQAIIDEINALSENQQPEPGERSDELGDAPQTAEGKDEQTYGPREIKQYKAEDILADPALRAMWLKQVQQSPARFLNLKFQLQLQNSAEGASTP